VKIMTESPGPASTLLDLFRSIPAESTAIIVPERNIHVTYGALRNQVEAAAQVLASAGVRRNDRVGIAVPRGLLTIVSVLAASIAGTAAPLNPAFKEEEFRFYLTDTAARILVLPRDGAEEARRAAGDAVKILTADMDSAGTVRLSGTSHGPSVTAPSVDDVALILHTSGSTARPKRVPLTHANLTVSARNVARTYRLAPDDVSLCVMPLRDHHVTWYSAVPTLHRLLLARAEPGSPRPEGASRLRFIRSGSAALAPQVMHDLEAAFGAPVLESYGMTEAAHQMASNPLPPAARKPGSVGLATGVAISTIDAEGRHLEPGERGEVVINGATVIRGYENNPGANAASFVDGWFRTGDQGYLDEDGYLTLVGRIKELINRGGEKISPGEIDEVLLAHPSVAEAVSFGVPHPTWGEEVAAAVVLREPVSKADLLAYCRERLADFKQPTQIYITDAIPRTATGKIQRRLVAQAFTPAAS
jgi:acyl-CoA synthetase (AMP-forming)/AMP-acid ligase II